MSGWAQRTTAKITQAFDAEEDDYDDDYGPDPDDERDRQKDREMDYRDFSRDLMRILQERGHKVDTGVIYDIYNDFGGVMSPEQAADFYEKEVGRPKPAAPKSPPMPTYERGMRPDGGGEI